MTHPPGGHMPPDNPGDTVPALLSEGEAWVGAAAFNHYGAEFFAQLGGIRPENVHPVGGGLRDSIVKLSTYVPVARELLNPSPPSDEDVARWRAKAEAERAREDARHAQMLAVGGVVAAIAGLHSPNDSRECEGCDGATEYAPQWPCRTWELLDEQAPR